MCLRCPIGVSLILNDPLSRNLRTLMPEADARFMFFQILCRKVGKSKIRTWTVVHIVHIRKTRKVVVSIRVDVARNWWGIASWYNEYDNVQQLENDPESHLRVLWSMCVWQCEQRDLPVGRVDYFQLE